jgi:hypothetical protein
MPRSPHEPAVLSFQPTSFKPQSFSVDRTSTTHTVFAMPLSDGCNESKPAQRPSGARRRFTNLFKPKQRTEADPDDISISDESVDNHSPMRFVTPRATVSTPVVTPLAKRRTYSFLHRQSNHKSKLDPVAASVSTQSYSSEPLVGAGHIPVTEVPYQSPSRKDSVAMPTSPTKDAALTSHPVVRLDKVESELSDRFMTNE